MQGTLKWNTCTAAKLENLPFVVADQVKMLPYISRNNNVVLLGNFINVTSVTYFEKNRTTFCKIYVLFRF